MHFDINDLKWTRMPDSSYISEDKIEIITKPHTDLWQRTYYHFRNGNAPVLQMSADEKYFSFVVKTEFESKHRFDQCGVVMYLDSENWLKGSIEYENECFQRLGSVVTNNGYSDWRGNLPSYDMQIKKAITRKDWVSVNHRTAAFLESYFDIIFALNKMTHPGEKRMVQYAKEQAKILPDNFEENLNCLLQNLFTNSDTIVQTLATMISALENVIEKNLFNK